MIGEGYCNQFVSVCLSFCLSLCAPFCPYSSKTMTSISLKFGGQVFHGVQTDSSKFGVICLKINQERVFLIFNWEYTVKLLLFITYVRNQYFAF